MSMNLNSPVKMLPQEVKTPLVPDSEMSSTIGSEEYKRKAGPDALAAPDAKKRATSTGLPIEDKTPLEVSSECSKEDKTALEVSSECSKLDCPESGEESDASDESYLTDDETQLLAPLLTSGPEVEANIRFITEPGDFKPLRAALDKEYNPATDLYTKRFKKALVLQETYERMVNEPVKKLRIHVVFEKNGVAIGGADYIPKKIKLFTSK